MFWCCAESHSFEANWTHVKDNGSWCPYCAGNVKPDIKQLQAFAINERNGTLLSTKYINAHTKYLWQCSELHKFETSWNSVKSRGSWCPTCASFKTERRCKEILEQKLGITFTKTRFYFEEQRLEFDGFNEEHRIAFEYHGEQHYEFPNAWHKTLEDYKAAQLRDDYKEQFAAENDITLLIIPYNEKYNLEAFIENLIQATPGLKQLQSA